MPEFDDLPAIDFPWGSIANGLAVCIDSAAVVYGFQGAYAFLNDFTAWLTIQRDDQTNAAGIVLITWVIRVCVDQFLAVFQIFFSKL